MRRNPIRFFVLFMILGPAFTGDTADLIEPWAPGFSDIEFYAGGTRGEGLTAASLVLGYGAPHGFSLGLLGTHFPDDADEVGIVAIWTTDLGDTRDLDLWILTAPPIERELQGAGISWEFGFEWSVAMQSGAVWYLRPSLVRQSSDWYSHPLVGLMIPLEPVELHIEISSEEPEGGRWPVHLAVGPNVLLSDTVELIPEFSVIDDRVHSELVWEASIGVIVTLDGAG